MKLANLDLRLDRSRRRPYRPGRDACGHWSLSPQNSPREQPASVVFTDRLSMIAAVQFAARRPYSRSIVTRARLIFWNRFAVSPMCPLELGFSTWVQKYCSAWLYHNISIWGALAS